MIADKHTVRMQDDDWAALQELAARTVRDKEVSSSAPVGATRVSALLRLLARGELLIVRPEAANQTPAVASPD